AFHLRIHVAPWPPDTLVFSISCLVVSPSLSKPSIPFRNLGSTWLMGSMKSTRRGSLYSLMPCHRVARESCTYRLMKSHLDGPVVVVNFPRNSNKRSVNDLPCDL